MKLSRLSLFIKGIGGSLINRMGMGK